MRADMLCKRCGSVLSAVTFECVRGVHCKSIHLPSDVAGVSPREKGVPAVRSDSRSGPEGGSVDLSGNVPAGNRPESDPARHGRAEDVTAGETAPFVEPAARGEGGTSLPLGGKGAVTPDEAAARKYRPSNGMEGMDFMEAFCFRCERDRKFQVTQAAEDGCPIVAATMIHDPDDPEYPAEWTFDAEGYAVCTAFEPLKPEGHYRCAETPDLFGDASRNPPSPRASAAINSRSPD